MLQTTLFIAIVIGIVTFLMQMAARWAGGQIGRDVADRLRAGEAIVNHRQVPEPWLLPYRKRIEAMRAAGKSQQEIERVGISARKHCLREIDSLILFFTKTNLMDGPDTRDTVLTTLAEQRACWAGEPWQTLFAAPAPERTGAETAADANA